MTDKNPRVSIGLAVRNGERYLDEAIQSILAQTYNDLELIISDNASDDRTAEICQHYARQDPRVRYYRNATNIGSAGNENRTFELARGEYFRWAAHDDTCAPTLIEKCVAVLDQQPNVVLCHSQTVNIDEHGRNLEVTSEDISALSSPSQRFAAMAHSDSYCVQTYGVIRSEVLRFTRLQQSYMSADRTLLAELGIYGAFVEIAEPLFYKRLHPSNVYLDWRVRMAFFNPANHGRIVFPVWLQLLDYLSVLRRVPLPADEKLRCYLYMPRWILKYGKSLVKDLLVAAHMLMHSQQWRNKRYEDLTNWA